MKNIEVVVICPKLTADHQCGLGVPLELETSSGLPHPVNFIECPRGLGFLGNCQEILEVPASFVVRKQKTNNKPPDFQEL